MIIVLSENTEHYWLKLSQPNMREHLYCVNSSILNLVLNYDNFNISEAETRVVTREVTS